jgi:hypothetical protein
MHATEQRPNFYTSGSNRSVSYESVSLEPTKKFETLSISLFTCHNFFLNQLMKKKKQMKYKQPITLCQRWMGELKGYPHCTSVNPPQLHIWSKNSRTAELYRTLHARDCYNDSLHLASYEAIQNIREKQAQGIDENSEREREPESVCGEMDIG